MSNELAFFGTGVIDLMIILIAHRMGKEFLMATVVTNIILVFIISSILVPLLGLVTTPGEVFYVAIFLATDILGAHYGKKEAYRSVQIGFMAVLLLNLFGQLILRFVPLEESIGIMSAIQEDFSFMPRLAVAGLTAY